MAFEDDLRNFLQSRLVAYDPSIDLSANSAAQLKIIEPIVKRFGEDPFSTDIPTFIKDRFVQEFPDMDADGGGMVEDILAKPLQMLLEPFKREIELVKLGMSTSNAGIMSEEEADALGANWFTDRDAGNFAGGTVRLYYAQPTTTRVGTDKRATTNDGKSYFPIQNYGISAQQMAFNRQGNFYFLDITVRAEGTGDEFNIDRGEITSIEDVPGVIKAANLSAFITGDPSETNEEYLARIEDSLTDRSNVTKRGILARVTREFDGVRALQVVGAGESGMNRDILTGTGQGFLHLAGTAVVYGNWIWVSEITYRDDGPTDSITPQPDDLIRFHPTSPAPAATTVVEANIVSILSSTDSLYLFLLDRSPYADGAVQDGAFALLKPGTITISGVPGGIAADVEVADNTVHLGGHTDVFARPTQDAEIQTTIQNVTDDDPIIAIIDLTVLVADQNGVHSAASDFEALGIKPEDLLIIDTGAGFAGTYQILEVAGPNDLRVNAIFPIITTSELRARIVRNIRLDLISPKVPKLPFTDSPVSDLQTDVGSNEFRFGVINIQDYGARQGDIIKVLDGPDAGEFTISNFGTVVGSVLMNRIASATGANLSYEVYTKQTGLTRPLVRLKNIEVLDSTGQTTGITVPYGDAIDIRPEFDFETAGRGTTTYDKQLVIFPDMPEWESGLTADPVLLASIDDTTDARYTLGLTAADGVVRKVTHSVGNQVETTEINVPPFLWNGRRDKIIALVSRNDPDFPTSVAGTHKSSDLAEASIGDSITIHDGPNQGNYLITDHRVLELWGKSDTGHRTVAVIQIDPPLPVDPIRTALSLIEDASGVTYTAAQLFGFLNYAADWDNASGFYETFLTQFRSTLTNDLGITDFTTNDELREFFDPLIRSSYTVGPSAKGTFRTYFLEPVSAEFYFGEDPTTFDLATDGSKTFRVDPELESAQILPESIVSTAPSLWNRNLGVRLTQDTYAYLTSGSSLAARGIRAGDELEIYPAINDLPARGDMYSSWVCVTQAGSNVVQLLLPQSDGASEEHYGGADNYTEITAGQLFFIDSGPDIGAYIITKVTEQDWVSNPPVLKVQLDQPLSHTTEGFPVLSTGSTPPTQADFGSGLPAFVQGSDLVFPLNLNATNLEIDISVDGGTSYTTVNHLFVAANPYANMAAVLADINADATFIASIKPISNGTALVLVHPTAGPRTRVRISTSPTGPSAHTLLGLTNGTVGRGVRGAATLAETKRIYGSGLAQFQVDDWVTLYAAKGGTILSNGDDEAVIGTYLVTAVGTDQASAPFWNTFDGYIELDRTADFPAGDHIEVRWVRHVEPETEPANTSGGGKEISDQFVRFRMYDSVSKNLTVESIPWTGTAIHPLLDTSEQQIVVESPGIIDTSTQRNYAHKSPFRILRPDVLRVSSTEMAAQREGALYYVDIPVVGYGPGEEMNVTTGDGFVLSGSRKIDGYTLEVDDENFTYSMDEELHLVLPNAVLPVGSTADLDNQFNLSGQNLQVTYNNAPLIEDLQSFFDAPLDRVTAASILVRHFLPAYVIFDATYAGGSNESVVATDLIKYINSIDPDTAEIRTDLLQDIIKRRGATTVTLPVTVIALFHGIDRRVRGMRSTTSIGSGDTPFFNGTFLQTYFIAGSDTSKETERPTGEQVFLRRT